MPVGKIETKKGHANNKGWVSCEQSSQLAKYRTIVERIRKMEYRAMIKFQEETLASLKANIETAPVSETRMETESQQKIVQTAPVVSETKIEEESQQKIVQTAPVVSETKIEEESEQKIVQVVNTMICQNCGRIPSPFARYLCPEGHMQCGHCAEKQIVVHFGKCMIEINNNEILHRKNDQTKVVPTCATPVAAPWQWNQVWLGKNHFPLCQEKIRLYPADPVFSGIWMNITWKCPHSKKGCMEMVKGCDLFSHITECTFSNIKTQQVVSQCAVKGCEAQITIKDAVEHLVLKHSIDAMYFGNRNGEARPARTGGLLYIPQSTIEAKRPYYTLVRCFKRFFLFCVEPNLTNVHDMCFWIRRISNKENNEEDNSPCFHYQLNILNKYSALQIHYKKECTKWGKPTNDVFNDAQSLTLPITMLLDQFVLCCEDDSDNVVADNAQIEEKGYLPVNFRIFVVNEVGDLFLTEDESNLQTSSLESLVSEISNENEYEGEEFSSFIADVDNGIMLETENVDDSETTRKSNKDVDMMDYRVFEDAFGDYSTESGSNSNSSDSSKTTEDGIGESDDFHYDENDLHNGQAQEQRLVRYDTPTSSVSSME